VEGDRRRLFTGAAIVALVAAALLWRQVGRPPLSAARRPAGEDPSTPAFAEERATPREPTAVDAALARAVRDARLHDEMRRRILGEAEPAAAPPPAKDRLTRRPEGTLDRDWLDTRMREDFRPMARACFRELLARDAGTEGRVQLRLTVVGDETIGGVIDEVTIDEDASTISDDRFRTCLTESMSTLALPPPAHGGTATVVVPLAVTAPSTR
jgi:hypothetical protein